MYKLFERGNSVLKRSKYISFLLAVLMLFTVFMLPFSANAAIDLSKFNLTTGQKYFLRVIGSLARADYYETDVLGSVTLAQAIYEGGWGRYSLPVGGNNLFGIKAYSTWSGQVYDQQTSMLYDSYEDFLFSAGQSYLNKYSAWRAHDSWAESVSVHSALFQNESKYAAVIGEKDYKVAAKAIVDAGYCNDYGYVDTVIELIEQYGLTEYDDLTPDENGIVAIVTKQERKLLDIGETYQVPLTFYPAVEATPEIAWKSDNESVATVDKNGVVTAVSHGMTLISATLENGREACCIVYVDCNATVIDKDAVIYTSASASASDNGKIYRGNAIKVTDSKVYMGTDGNQFYKVSGYNSKNVLVSGYALKEYVYLNKRNVSNIAVVKDEFTLKVGDTYTVKTAVSPADAVDTELKWTSNNEAVATVDNGVIKAKAKGTAIITAKADGGAERKLTVKVDSQYREYDAIVSAYETLTVRTEPDSSSSRVGTLPYLSEVKVSGEPNGLWYNITGTTSNGKVISGYANSVYVRILNDGCDVTYGEAGDGISVYAEKNTASLSYGTLIKGSEYAVLDSDEASGWSYIIGIKTTNEAIYGYAKLDSSNNTDDPNIGEGSDTVPAGSYYGRTTSALNVRSGAGSSYGSVGQFADGATVIITGEAVNGWYPVMGTDKDGNSVSGYSSSDFITVLYLGTVNATTLNVRDEAVSGAVIGQFDNGTEIVVVGDAVDGWYAVESKDGEIKGYCSADYIVINGKLLATGNGNSNPNQGFGIVNPDYSIVDDKLLGVAYETTVEEVMEGFTGDVKLVDKFGNELDKNALAGTGNRIQVTVDGKTSEIATLVVLGDVDGDGDVKSADYILVKRHFMNNYKLEGVYYEAALVHKDCTEIDVVTYILMKRLYFGTYTIKN